MSDNDVCATAVDEDEISCTLLKHIMNNTFKVSKSLLCGNELDSPLDTEKAAGLALYEKLLKSLNYGNFKIL